MIFMLWVDAVRIKSLGPVYYYGLLTKCRKGVHVIPGYCEPVTFQRTATNGMLATNFTLNNKCDCGTFHVVTYSLL